MTTYCATPAAGTVRDRNGKPAVKATRRSYPLTATCRHCGTPITAALGPDEWFHTDGHLRCEYAKVCHVQSLRGDGKVHECGLPVTIRPDNYAHTAHPLTVCARGHISDPDDRPPTLQEVLAAEAARLMGDRR